MINKLYVSCAGSGKTSLIVNNVLQLERNERVLITTFTDSNCEEIGRKFISKIKYIPSNVNIVPWFTFLLTNIIKPYQVGFVKSEINGTIMVNKQSVPFEDIHHETCYIKDNKIYTDKIAQLSCICLKENSQLILKRLSKIYHYIYIDEAQDLTGLDLNVVNYLLSSDSEILMVCDPRQKTFSTHYSKYNKKYKDNNLDYFKQIPNLSIDYTTLNGSYRCSEDVISYASKLFPSFKSSHSLKTRVNEAPSLFLVRRKNISQFCKEHSNVIHLVYNSKIKVSSNFRRMNFGVSKGLTLDNVLIYPTKEIQDAVVKDDMALILSNLTKCKFYVALTRSKGVTGIVIDDNKKEIKSKLPIYMQ